MNSGDYSKLIYQRYFGPENKEVKIFLKDETSMEGVIVGVFHGDETAGEPYVIKWHVVPKKDVEIYDTADDRTEIGQIILQEDIEAVRLK